MFRLQETESVFAEVLVGAVPEAQHREEGRATSGSALDQIVCESFYYSSHLKSIYLLFALSLELLIEFVKIVEMAVKNMLKNNLFKGLTRPSLVV